ncbi:MAG TPA: alpha/beta hydrolase [Bacillus bacterium]|uniref:Phospholipase n=1 Tax=Siminovitchia fordii TaxID=254759 RepID=A0ABQ4K7K4_9BACI|nr:alpha/beta hydrolase [Siminovitchia fordii]GIN21712.1 phospholipase [Siminovitchia fordii]HBZ12000.1 alpha/beta hydrolase [Bacillus sp. (in: firmicutes)]
MRKWGAEGKARGVIVIVHGAMEHHGRYRWLRDMWVLSGFHVVMGDLPGQGLTTRTHRGHIDSFDEYVMEVKKWIQEAVTYRLPVFLLGHSMGGLTVIRLLQEEKQEIAGVILSSPCLGLVNYPPMPVNALSVGLNWIAPELKVDSHLDVDLATRNPDAIDRALNDSLLITKVSVRWYRELLKAMKEAFTNISKFPDIPLLVMQGGDDKIVNKTDVRNWFDELVISEKLYKEWSKCYHEIFNEPEREMIFDYAKNFAELRLRLLPYKI